jgi:hypothetical protein
MRKRRTLRPLVRGKPLRPAPSGWKGDSKRHRLAALGIRTKKSRGRNYSLFRSSDSPITPIHKSDFRLAIEQNKDILESNDDEAKRRAQEELSRMREAFPARFKKTERQIELEDLETMFKKQRGLA